MERGVAGERTGPPPRVLFVDDEPGIAQAAGRMLAKLGFEVVTATTPLEALSAAHSTPVDVVVLDIHLPSFSGIELGHELRANGVDVPILFISGDPAALDEARAAGFQRMSALAKPYSAEELRAAVERALGRGEAPPLSQPT